jgi:hypothetical protein
MWRSGSRRRQKWDGWTTTAVTVVGCIVLVAFAIVAASAGAAGTPTPLQTRADVDELVPTALPGFEAWWQRSNATPSHSDVFGVARAGGNPFKINASGTNGYWPSAVQGTASVITSRPGARRTSTTST